MEDTLIEIPFNEYKELLIIKGRYEELKSLYKPSCPGPCYPTTTPTPYPPTITWTTYTDDDKKTPEEEYRVTLKNNSNDTYTTISESGINIKQEDKRKKR